MLLLVDANVLIDFLSVDESVLTLAVHHLGPVFIPRDVFEEVEQLCDTTCARLELTVVDGSLAQIAEAGTTRGGLSFADRMCLILSRDHGWTCVSNDGRLRRACDEAGVAVKWGLQLLLELVDARALTGDVAVALAEDIVSLNRWISPTVLDAFRAEIASRTSK